MAERPKPHVFEDSGQGTRHCADCGHHLEASWHWVMGKDLAHLEAENAALRLNLTSMGKFTDEVKAEADALRAENARIEEVCVESNAVCICGCPSEDHEQYDEGGESCADETHTCIRVCESAAAEFRNLRADLAALKERTCHNCRHKSLADGDWCGLLWIACDGLYATINLTHYIKCERIGFTCGSWTARKGAND